MTETAGYYSYWGKAKPEGESGPAYHLLPYHCLDVAAVADQWLEQSLAYGQRFCDITGLDKQRTRAWLLFFIALHDYGKFDLRFQRKAGEAWKAVNRQLSAVETHLNGLDIKTYNHGPAGLYWFYQDLAERFSSGDDDFSFDDNEEWEAWCSWLAPVVGHHGILPKDDEKDNPKFNLLASNEILDPFKQSRLQWLQLLERFFLLPAGLNLSDTPPRLETSKNNQSTATMLAGFCSVCDWLGSSERFDYDAEPCNDLDELKQWYAKRISIAKAALFDAGVLSRIKPYQTLSALLTEGSSPRQVQCLVDSLPITGGLTIIEASTGSGKTEAALAYAWKLLASGLADSIVFALPTQATANAMLSRLDKAAPLLFSEQTNLVLAHGRAKYQRDFIDLKKACRPQTAQGEEEAWVQCGNWLAQSRKRVFLGQIGVCTVDQVLVSVLPVKHKFVRGFGIGRSVLIVDEVHAYDSYMYGLLEAVLEQQRLAGGCAILLSATLPFEQKRRLAKAWNCDLPYENKRYPLICHCQAGGAEFFDLSDLPEQQPKSTTVGIELFKISELLPDENLVRRMLNAVEQGTQVCLVCNLVAVAQQIYQVLLQLIQQSPLLNETQLLLFHSRFIFADRQKKEQTVLEWFGPESEERCRQGHLLIATQVVEQSLDLDFDWLITQLCPVDLLFQRMGRLHRHAKNQIGRPLEFAKPVCTILLPKNIDYDLHAVIYGNSRVLWRTQQLLEQAAQKNDSQISFPNVYREWIELVYQENTWCDEPESVSKSYEKFELESESSRSNALRILRMNPGLDDNDSNVSALTRDGEMNLNILPTYIDTEDREHLLNDECLNDLDESNQTEAFNLNTIAVPRSWANQGRLPKPEQDGLIKLHVQRQESGGFIASHGNYSYLYHADTGLTRIETTEESK
ncbi:CRISPR-associated helicase/endonuclease Cas3 [Methylicorpusculum sp.]|uniref:CRISPR-associated helicase/endonuclease Cas3 n=1 Tax=Methylicorpusculum sp. TaxID=2713644 RepID=UPI00271A7254|nr:CRISPR-associated helicase/endonuclease Cas3 [Methylicorpusculum sp.]MDO8843406.1 CRISPR-associated helicase/endonuclease Cas3 [Methylicorpusculum sp.]